jgi:hypothetical protein
MSPSGRRRCRSRGDSSPPQRPPFPASNLRRRNWRPWQNFGEFLGARFASDGACLYAPVSQKLANKPADRGSGSSDKHDDPGARPGEGSHAREGRARVDQHLRSDFVRNRIQQTHDRASLNDDLVPQRVWCREERHPKTRFQSQTRGDPGAGSAYNASAFESGDPPTRAVRRRHGARHATQAADFMKVAF